MQSLGPRESQLISVALSDKCKLRSEAQFYCFLFHTSQKSLTVAGSPFGTLRTLVLGCSLQYRKRAGRD